MSIKDKLKLIRHENYWTQLQAADECGVSYALWRLMEQGVKTNPRLDTLVKIAARCRKSIDWLVDYYPDWRQIFKNSPK